MPIYLVITVGYLGPTPAASRSPLLFTLVFSVIR